jgi:hypothetical protein
MKNEEESSMKIRVFRDAEIRDGSETVQKVQFFNTVNTDTLNKMNQIRDNTGGKETRANVMENKLKENKLVLKYMHKKFGQVNLKRKRTFKKI